MRPALALLLAALAVLPALPGAGLPVPATPGLPMPHGPVPLPSMGIPQIFSRACEDLSYQLQESASYAKDVGWSSATGHGVVVSTGESYHPGSMAESDYVTVAHDAASGAPLWTQRYDGPGHDEDHPYSVSVDAQGLRAFVTGWSRGSAGDLDDATVAYDLRSGAQLWAARFDGPGHGDDYGWTVRPSPDGQRVYVTGYALASLTDYDFATIAYDAATGAQLWASLHDGPMHAFDWAYLLAVSPDGSRVLVDGWDTTPQGLQDFSTVAYDARTGQELWVARAGGPGEDVATDVVVSPDGSSAYVTGFSMSATGTDDFLTIAYDLATGQERWQQRYDGPAHGPDDAMAVRYDPATDSVVTMGNSLGLGTMFDTAVVAYDARTGAERWEQRLDGTAHAMDFPMEMELAPSTGALVITACSQGPGADGAPQYDALTLALRPADGQLLWQNRLDRGGGDAGWSLDADAGTIAVTGWSESPDRGYDLLTQALDPATGATRWVAAQDAPR
jgi:outer membrane protein assembly factor BamB